MNVRLIISALAAVLLLNGQPLRISLEEATQEAIAHNLDLAAARFNISIAEARQITAALRPNPVMTVSGDHLDVLGTGYNTINNGGPNEYAFRTDFVMERGGKRIARMNLASAEKTVAELGVRDAVRRLIFEVQSAYVDVQSAREIVKIERENLRRLNDIVAINAARVKSGDLAEVEWNRSQVAAMQYQTAVRQAELQLQQAKTRLLLLMGRADLTTDIEVGGEIRKDEQSQVTLDSLKSLAQARRPDLELARRSQARNQADLKLQMAQGRVDYTTGTEYRRQQAVSGRGNSLGIFFSAPLPVFNRNQGEIARAEREVAQAGTLIRAAEARINGEAVTAFQQYQTSFTLLRDIEQRMLSKANDVLQATDYSYRRGEATLVEFLDAQRAFSDVMQSYTEARASYAKGLYLIDSVTAASVQDK
jgi:cobalt-zinc-cadmium efflux system outer membrane protein